MDILRNRMCSSEITVPAVGESHEKARVGDSDHASKPRLLLKLGIPSTLPATSRKG